MRAAIYARISRDAEGEGLGVDRQREDCRALCARRNWTLVGEYVDNDCSAYSGRTRPGYQRLIGDVRSGLIDVVVSWAPERLHRSPRELEDFLELIESTGTGVETIKAGVWDVSTSHGRLVARMLGAVSRAESERMGERISRAHQQAKGRGLWRGPIPYGMRASERPGHPEPDPEQAGVVEQIFQRVQRGDALTKIASDLNATGLRPRRGTAWTHTGISRLIQSPALGGLVEIENQLQPAAFEGVVTAQQWRAARAALRRRPLRERRRPPEKLTLLGGIMCCDEHDHVCVGSSASHAATYCAGLPGQCFVSITRAAADLAVSSLVVARLQRPDARELLRVDRDTTDVDAEIEELVRRRDEVGELVAEGLLTAGAARPQLVGIKDRILKLETARSPLLVSPDALIDPAAAWEAWSVPQRRDVVRLLFTRVSLVHVGPYNGPRADPRRVRVVWTEENKDASNTAAVGAPTSGVAAD